MHTTTTTTTTTTYPTSRRIYTPGVVVVGQLWRGVKHAWEWTTEVEYKARAQTERDRLNLSKSTRGSFDLDPTMPSTRRSKRMRSTKCTDPIRYGSFMFISFFLFFLSRTRFCIVQTSHDARLYGIRIPAQRVDAGMGPCDDNRSV